jgi:hypothetical protein
MRMGFVILLSPVLNIAGKVLGAVFKDRPTMEVWPERFLAETVFMNLRVSNPAWRKVLIQSISVQPKLFNIWLDATLEYAVDAKTGVGPKFILEAGETKLLPMLTNDREEHGGLCRKI